MAYGGGMYTGWEHQYRNELGTSATGDSSASRTAKSRSATTRTTNGSPSSPNTALVAVGTRALPAVPGTPTQPITSKAVTTPAASSSPNPIATATAKALPGLPQSQSSPSQQQIQKFVEARQEVVFADIPPGVQKLIDGWIEGGAIEELTTKERVERLNIECFDREDEIEVIANQIACANKNCVIVSAKPGMGKTTMMNHIASLVMDGTAPIGFRNKRIFLIIKPSKALEIFQAVDRWFGLNCILFCDEVHQIFAKSSPENGFKLSLSGNADPEALKPYIGDGRVSLVGFTDRAHGSIYAPGFLDDDAWDRRFYELVLPDMSITAAIKVLKRARPKLQQKFETRLGKPLEITDEAIEVAVKLSDWLYPRQQFPDKASHVLEPACSAKMRTDTTGGKVTILEDDIINFIMHKRKPKYSLKTIKQGLAEVDLRSKMKYIPAGSPLMEFCEDLSMRAAIGELQPAYGREKTLKQLLKTFSAGISNNAVLYGPHGCGKTRIAYGFACMIARDEVPEHLKGVHVLLLDLPALIGGTQYRGQLEKRVSSFLRSAKEHLGKFILFIDEFHMVIGAGAYHRAASNDIANYFKNALGDGHLPTVGMTNEPDAVRADGAFARRFRFYEVPVFDAKETIECMKMQKVHIESHYSQLMNKPFTVDPGAMEAAVTLGQKMPNEYLPASAFKLLDLACGAVVADACEAPEPKEVKGKAAAQIGEQALIAGATGLVVKQEHVESAAKDAIGSAPKVQQPQPVISQRALTDRITQNFMGYLPPDMADAGPAIKHALEYSVRRALASPESPEEVASKASAAAKGSVPPPPSAGSLIEKVIRDQSTCVRLVLWICNAMSAISDLFSRIFCYCAPRKELPPEVVKT